MLIPQWVWVTLGVVGVVIMGVFVWFLLTTIIPLLFNVLLGLSLVLVVAGFVMLAIQDTGRRPRRRRR